MAERNKPFAPQGKHAVLQEIQQTFPTRAFASEALEFLQLLCEGHNIQLQHFLRTQKGLITADVDLVTATFELLRDLEVELDDDCVDQALQCLETLTEMLQGIDSDANARVLISSKLVDLLDRLIRTRIELLFADGDEVRIEQDTVYHFATSKRAPILLGGGSGEVLTLHHVEGRYGSVLDLSQHAGGSRRLPRACVLNLERGSLSPLNLVRLQAGACTCLRALVECSGPDVVMDVKRGLHLEQLGKMLQEYHESILRLKATLKHNQRGAFDKPDDYAEAAQKWSMDDEAVSPEESNEFVPGTSEAVRRLGAFVPGSKDVELQELQDYLAVATQKWRETLLESTRDVGFELYIALRKLNDSTDEVASAHRPSHMMDILSPTVERYFQRTTGHVELCLPGGRIQRMYFRFPKKCLLLTEARKEEFHYYVDRDTPGAGIQEFFASVPLWTL